MEKGQEGGQIKERKWKGKKRERGMKGERKEQEWNWPKPCNALIRPWINQQITWNTFPYNI